MATSALPHDKCRSDGACRLLALPGQSLQNPASSPDGRELLFTAFTKGYNKGPAELRVVSLERPSSIRVVVGGAADNVNMPGASWNPATGLVAFASDAAGKEAVFVVPAAGGAPRRVTPELPVSCQEPTLSPGGDAIVFEQFRDDNNATIHSIRTDGSGLVQLTSGAVDRQPNWAPSGDRILFQRRLGTTWAIFTMRPDGSDLVRITPESTSATDAAFSEDGARIVFSGALGAAATTGASLWIVPVSGGSPARLTTTTGYDGAATFSRGASYVVFETSAGDDQPTELWWVVVPGG